MPNAISRTTGPVARRLVGETAPSARPGDDESLYGTAELLRAESAEVRSFQTFILKYTAGRIGIDDTGAIRVSFRMVGDGGVPQTEDPAGANFTSAECSGTGRIELAIGPHGERPWKPAVTAMLRGGYLSEGDTIMIVFGDTRHGSPGLQMQSFEDPGFEFRVSADVQATGNFVPLRRQFAVPVVPGAAKRWKAVLPSCRRVGESFALGLKAEDVWGNPTSRASGLVRFVPSMLVSGLPSEFEYSPDDRSMCFDGLRTDATGTLRIRVIVDGAEVAEAGPLAIREGGAAGYWGDLHGQSGETIGINSAENYFDFARNKAFLDVASHQGNDFQINSAFWKRLNEITAATNEPGRFTTFPGYEWSGNTAVGGDRNVFFRNEGRQIRRCSHALLEDRSDAATDASTLEDLYASLNDEDCVIYAHVGGRYADIARGHDPRLETAVEIHSAWGTFEWILTDGFPLGRRVGVVANSDGHDGRPGACYPGAHDFGAYGGLTCFLADRNDRDAIFEAQRRRHHFATTGCRMHMDVDVRLPGGGELFERNPDAVPRIAGKTTSAAAMGDIVRTGGDVAELSALIVAHAGIERVEVRGGAEVLETFRPYEERDLGERVRVVWSGAEYRGRGRHTTWRGRAIFDGRTIDRFETINRWNPERRFERCGANEVIWDSVTTGNFMGFDAWLSGSGGKLEVATNHGDIAVDLEELGLEDLVMDAGGLERKLRIFRLPEERMPREFHVRRTIPLRPRGDTPVWICVTTEDGHQAWSSPVYLFK